MTNYTRKELGDLCMALRERGHIIGVFLKKKDTDKWTLKDPEEIYASMVNPKGESGTRFVRTPQGDYKTIWSGRYGEVRELMFSAPLEDMPLFINDSLLSIIAKWRLRIAR
jgi:hypothetical protein